MHVRTYPPLLPLPRHRSPDCNRNAPSCTCTCVHRPCSSMDDGWMAVSHARPPSPAQEDTACGRMHSGGVLSVSPSYRQPHEPGRTVRYSTRRGAIGRDRPRPRPRASICCHCYTDICTCKLAFPLFLIPRSTTSKHHASHACVSAVSSSILASISSSMDDGGEGGAGALFVDLVIVVSATIRLFDRRCGPRHRID